MAQTLEGRTVALAEGRQLEALAQLLEKEGAKAWRCPMVGIHDAPDANEVNAWTRELIADRFSILVLMTGEAVNRLLGFAEHVELRDQTIAAFGRTRLLCRGPKPVKVLKELGLAAWKMAETPTTSGVIATLKQEKLEGITVGVTLYGEPNPTLVKFLEDSGAIARTVLPYVLAPASDADRVAELIERLADGSIHVILFTSSSQVERLFSVAAQRSQEANLSAGLAKARVAAIGPVLAETLQHKKVRVDICPAQGFVMKNLVQLIKRDLGGT